MSSDDKKFLSRRDVELRLNGCLVKYKGKYFRAGLPTSEDGATEADTRLALYSLNSGRKTASVLDSNSTDFQYLFYDSLGWLPHNLSPESMPQSAYIARAPLKRYKAGLSPNALISALHHYSFGSGDGVGQSTVESNAFINMLEGVYPKVPVILDFINSLPELVLAKHLAAYKTFDNIGFWNVALYRDWALRIYKDRAAICHGLFEVGDFNLKTKEVKFLSSYNNSFYWEKFNERFVNELFLNVGDPYGVN